MTHLVFRDGKTGKNIHLRTHEMLIGVHSISKMRQIINTVT